MRITPLLASLLLTCQAAAQSAGEAIRFEDASAAMGIRLSSATFSIVATDLDRDGMDDILLGRHSRPPVLLLNRPGGFTDASAALPVKHPADRHGYTVVDLDNDGDLDIAIAAGGADGFGIGSPNQLLANQLRETRRLAFSDVSAHSDIARPRHRSRQLFPLPTKDGSALDLYLTAVHQHREDSTNLLFRNSRRDGVIALHALPNASLARRLESDGKDLFFDFDRDGDLDFLHLGNLQTRLYRNEGGEFTHYPSRLDELHGVRSAAAADFNNDGYADLYFGGRSGKTDSDRVSFGSDRLHFSVYAQQGDTQDSLSLAAASASLSFDLSQHNPEIGRTSASSGDIFLGAGRHNPDSRKGSVSAEAAAGAPASTEAPGTYIWFDRDSARWTVLWRHHNSGGRRNGMFAAHGIAQLRLQDMEQTQPREVYDYLLVNRAGEDFELRLLDSLRHRQWTNYVTAADFDNDGLVDIAGVRSREESDYNGEAFIAINRGDLRFDSVPIMPGTADDLYRSGLVVHGFFNDDGLPDLLRSNGMGLPPNNRGPYQLWLNASATDNGYLLLELEGGRANRDAVGAWVDLFDRDGTLLGHRQLGPGYGRGQDSHKLHFGLGQQQGPFRLAIRWPGDTATRQVLLAGSGFYRLRQPE
ncbi:MAG: hypothetical protein CME59_09970 [Halioglobus sp.]|nr:hypothetical protein [Halioglobus sp.]